MSSSAIGGFRPPQTPPNLPPGSSAPAQGLPNGAGPQLPAAQPLPIVGLAGPPLQGSVPLEARNAQAAQPMALPAGGPPVAAVPAGDLPAVTPESIAELADAYFGHLRPALGGSPEDIGQAIAQGQQLIRATIEACERFTAADPAHPAKPEVDGILEVLREHRDVLEVLGPGDQPPGHTGPLTLQDMVESMIARHQAGEVDLAARRAARQEVISQPAAGPQLDLTPYTQAGFTAGEAQLLHDSGLGVQGGRLFRERQIPITAQTVPGLLRPSTQVGAMTPLGSGNFNTTYTVRIGPGSPPAERVFKPVPTTERGWVASMTGIDEHAPRTALRNLATVAAATELNFRVVVETELGIGQPPPPPPDAPPVAGLVMERAQGRTGYSADRALLASAQARQQLLQLQFMDHVAAQGDRHANNYMIWQDAQGQVQVRGIDNDQCWGLVMRADDIAQGTSLTTSGYRGTRMPPVVDEETAAALRALTPQALNAILEARGMNDGERLAAELRLDDIHGHLDALESGNPSRIVPLARLADAEITALFTPANSYIGRELAYQPIS